MLHGPPAQQTLGPAGGFRVEAAWSRTFADPATAWAYLCEDDVGLFSLPSPRIADLVDRVDRIASSRPPVGAVVAYGRRFVGRGCPTPRAIVPPPGARARARARARAWRRQQNSARAWAAA